MDYGQLPLLKSGQFFIDWAQKCEPTGKTCVGKLGWGLLSNSIPLDPQNAVAEGIEVKQTQQLSWCENP